MSKIGWLLVLSSSLLVGCLAESDRSSTHDIEAPQSNLTPTAVAGQDVSAYENQTLELSALLSTDEDGTIVTYEWSQVSGSEVTLQNVQSAQASFITPDSPSELVFEITVTDDVGASHADQVTVSVNYFYQAAPAIANITYTPGPKVAHNTADECDTFENNIIRSDTLDNLRSVSAQNVAIMWGNSDHLSSDTQDFLNELEDTQSVSYQNVQSNLLELQRIFKEDFKLDISNNRSAVDNKCYRIPFVLWETEIWQDEFNSLSGGWAACAFSSERNLPLVAVPVGVAQLLASTTPIQSQMLAHEFFHALHCTSGFHGDENKGWEWSVESFANYVGNVTAGTLVAAHQFHENHHMSLNNSLKRYGIWPFWIYMNHEFGPDINVDVVIGQSTATETLFEFIRRRAPFDCPDNDDACSQQGFANLYGRYANSTVNLIPYFEDAGLDIYNQVHIWNETQTRDNAAMDKVASNQYRIAPWMAPHRYGHNIIELIPDPTQTEISVGLKGWNIPIRESEFRATLIATLDEDVNPRVEAQGEMFITGTQVVDLAAWENQLGQEIKRLHLVVAAVPSNWVRDSQLGDYSDATRTLPLDQYMYELTIKGGWPKGHEPLALLTQPVVAGQLHSNGNGFVADSASVEASAYVGPFAQVLDNAQVLGQARIEGRATIQHDSLVQDNAIVSTYSSIDLNAQILDNATVRDNGRVYRGAVVKDNAKVQGEVFLYDSFSMEGKAMAMNVPLIETTGGSGHLLGTAIMNGDGYFSEGSASMGTSRNNYSEDDLGLLLHYDFETPHPYRINDTHGNSDAFFVFNTQQEHNSNVVINAETKFTADSTLSSQVLTFSADGFLELPKWLLDQTNFSLEFLFNANAIETNTESESRQTLLSARSQNNEYLTIELVANTGSADGLFVIELNTQDRDGTQTSQTLTNNMLAFGAWLKLTLDYNDTTKTLTLSTTPQAGGDSAQVASVLSYGTRVFQYESLRIVMGADLELGQGFLGKVDALRVMR
ncbi:MAG: DUF6055 domain-containing protein [Bermanella sp.]